MKKHHSKVQAPRGRITAGLGHVDLGGIQIPGRWPVLLVTIKTGSGNYWRQFVHFCRKHGVVFKVAGKKEELQPRRPRGHSTVYEVKGGPALEALTEQRFCLDWCYPLHVGAPHFNSSIYRR